VFQALRNDLWLAIVARGYLGEEPVYLRSEIAWAFPGSRTREQKVADVQVFHCDINFGPLKFLLYPNDAGPTDGPRKYIKRDVRSRKWVLS
jgi:hypothetical protein